MDIAVRRRFYAEEIQAISNLRTPALVEALATTPRERFLGPGPWTIRSESDFQAAPRTTPSADPSHLYHNVAVAIDPARQLFNGAPGLLAMTIDHLGLHPGDRALHIGAGTGYYTALIGACVGPGGAAVAIEVDEGLAARARVNLEATAWVDVRHGDGSAPLDGSFDAILVNAGVSHPLDAWLDALAEGGRIIVPLTVPMTPTIGKGLMVLLTKRPDPATLDARVIAFVAIYSALGVRDEIAGAALAAAMRTNPFPQLKDARRDPHEQTPACWLHAGSICLTI
ncbi:MAG TPA: methyltransferase domain-containing protein [Vicinamibacterales bacterium]|nr:methyltransferase domain-containing protein [Vicinamibacterales bacterium]